MSNGRFESQGGVKAATPSLLPKEGRCNICGDTKPILEMIVAHLKRKKLYYLRPHCKQCHNRRERGHRRDYKKRYLRRWRRENAALNGSYWKGNAERRESARVNRARRLLNQDHHDAVLIQGRMRRRGANVPLKEAKELLKRFGCCYPSRFGLTPAGLRECERIRSVQRSRGSRRFSAFAIRLMVYEDGIDEQGRRPKPYLVIKPGEQPNPYQSAAENLRAWHRRQRTAEPQRIAA